MWFENLISNTKTNVVWKWNISYKKKTSGLKMRYPRQGPTKSSAKEDLYAIFL